jgi:NarL family two-component system sensor histidine kinase LiaS
MIFLIQELYPATLKEQGLATVLREYAYEWENRNDEIGVDLKINGECSLPLQAEQALYRITQEALANVARHSHASQVKISLNYQPEVVELAIEDNGDGYDPQRVTTGLGLHSMQERVTMIHGELSIHSAPGQGTQIVVKVPREKLSKGD